MPITLERIPHEKQVAIHSLLSLGYPTRKIAKTVQVSQNTVCFVNQQVQPKSTDNDAYKKQLLGWQYSVAQRAMCRITDDKLEKMNALQLMTINAIGIDKARDMEGSNRPVFNIVTMVGDITKNINELKSKQQALLALREQQTNVNV